VTRDLFRTTHKAKIQQVVKNRGQNSGDIELSVYLPNVSGSVPSVLDLLIVHDRFGRTSVTTSDPTLNGNLHYPTDIDRSLNETTADKIRKHRSDYNNNPPNPISFYLLLQVRLEGYIVNLYSFILTGSSGNRPLFCRSRSSACVIFQWTLPLLTT
jgi:hypothetical protein